MVDWKLGFWMVPGFFAPKTHILAYHLATVRNVLNGFARDLTRTSILAARFISQNFVNIGWREISFFLAGSQFLGGALTPFPLLNRMVITVAMVTPLWPTNICPESSWPDLRPLCTSLQNFSSSAPLVSEIQRVQPAVPWPVLSDFHPHYTV